MNKRDSFHYSGLRVNKAGLASVLDQFRPRERKTNPYLAGNYAPVTAQIFESKLQVKGCIPKELTGIYLRNGPNPMETVNNKKHHWFRGKGMLHGLKLDGGEALWYRNKSIGYANTHVISQDGKLYATVEAGRPPIEVDEDFTPTGGAAFEGTLTSGFSAHAKLDNASGELHAICYEFPKGRYRVNYVVVGENGRIKRNRSIDLSTKTMLHECAITKNYVLVFDLSVTFSLYKLARGYFPFSWNDSHQARIGLLNRIGSDDRIQWFHINSCYLFHVFNAFEDDEGHVIVDALRYQRLFDDDWNGPFTGEPPMLTRWSMDVTNGTIVEGQKDDLPAEFPRVHPALDGLKHRFGYCLGTGSMQDPDFGRIIKYDFATDSREIYELAEHEFGAEPIFIPAEKATSEDDGFLMAFVYDRSIDTSNVQIFHAQQISNGPIATIMLPQRVPYGFHGNWIPA